MPLLGMYVNCGLAGVARLIVSDGERWMGCFGVVARLVAWDVVVRSWRGALECWATL